jgi:6-pyruvoyltetrahydropterin/6-carboxytetrahydropterin synthase
MYKIYKSYQFSAAHSVNIPCHKCSNIHGHNYKVTFCFSSESLDNNGFVIDVSELEPIKKIVSNLDHKNLNHFFKSPTSENLCRFFYLVAKRKFKNIEKVILSETDSIYAEYSE